MLDGVGALAADIHPISDTKVYLTLWLYRIFFKEKDSMSKITKNNCTCSASPGFLRIAGDKVRAVHSDMKKMGSRITAHI